MTSGNSNDFFATTRWTMVLAAGNAGHAGAAPALAELCRIYWYPLYGYTRRQGFSKEDAEDCVQGFFAELLRRRDFAGVTAEGGKFRAFLLASLKHFLANKRTRAGRQKRGGDAAHLSLDFDYAEAKFEIADFAGKSPDAAFDREWATALLERVLALLQAERERAGDGKTFSVLKKFLMPAVASGDGYSEAAAQTGTDEGALRVAAHRLRKRYRELLKSEIAHTLASPESVEEELAALMAAFR